MNVQRPIEDFLREAGVPRGPFIMLHRALGNELADTELVVVAVAVDKDDPLLVSLTAANLRVYRITAIADEGGPEPLGGLEVVDYGVSSARSSGSIAPSSTTVSS